MVEAERWVLTIYTNSGSLRHGMTSGRPSLTRSGNDGGHFSRNAGVRQRVEHVAQGDEDQQHARDRDEDGDGRGQARVILPGINQGGSRESGLR